MRAGLLQLLIVALLAWAIPDAYGEGSGTGKMLLVTSTETGIGRVSNEDLRKAFLAIPVSVDGKRLRPLLNESEKLLAEVFLQKIIFMSRDRYERQLVARVFRQGGKRPSAFRDFDDLVAELHASPNSITYMWSDQFEAAEGLKELGTLWQGEAR